MTPSNTSRLRAAILGCAILAGPALALERDLASYVDPFVGSWAPGFTNPGPAVPHGMVGLGPDTAEGPLNYGGYYVQNVAVTGFSHVHMSAGVFQGGQVPLMPVTGDVTLGTITTDKPIPFYLSPFERVLERAEPGYYATTLLRYGVGVELTATTRVGMHRYAFPPGVPGSVVLHASRDLKGLHPASVEIADDTTLLGRVTTRGPTHTIHFAVRFDRAFESAETFSGTTRSTSTTISGSDVGAILAFGAGGGVVHAKVGLSYVDEAGALANLEGEIPGWDFDEVRSRARAAWNEALGRIEVEGGTPAERRSFYTALYHAQLFPNVLSDVDGRYPVLQGGGIDTLPDGRNAQYTQFSLWDSYRGQNQLLAVIDPEAYREMILSLLANVRAGKGLPRWQLADQTPNYMSGAPVIPFVAEGWCRGLVAAEDEDDLYDAMRAHVDAEWGSDAALGYLPTPQPENLVEVLVEGSHRSAGTTLELGVADFALALVADASGRAAERDALAARSLAYRNLLDPETGWIRPKDSSEAFAEPFLPESDFGFQEGTSWQYSWLAMHDLRGLFDRMGGDATVDGRLDLFFGFPLALAAPGLWPQVQNQITAFGTTYKGNQYAPGNEHDLEAPWLYAYSGAPWKSQAVSRSVAAIFTPTPNGLPGNDDLGALSGWLAWAMLGLYPMTPGAPVYVVGSPTFERAVIHRPSGDLVLEAPGASPLSRFVTELEIGETSVGRAWLTEAEWSDAGTIRLPTSLLPVPTFGAALEDAPPSLSTHPIAAFACR